MNSDKLHDWLQIIGLAAVVASLIFVGLQLKQSQEIAIANQYQSRFESIAGVASALMQSDAALHVLGKDVREEFMKSDALSTDAIAWMQDQPDDELAYRALYGTLRLKVFDNLHFQYQSGFLSDEAWMAHRSEFAEELNDSRFWTRAAFERRPESWRESFRKLVNELSEEHGGPDGH